MTPDSHPVFNETRLVYRVIKLEQELGNLREINESQQETINWLKVELEKRGEISRARGRTMAFMAFEQKRVGAVLHQTLTKFRKTRKHLGLLTNQTTTKLAAIKCRLDNLESQMQDLTSSFACLSIQDTEKKGLRLLLT